MDQGRSVITWTVAKYTRRRQHQQEQDSEAQDYAGSESNETEEEQDYNYRHRADYWQSVASSTIELSPTVSGQEHGCGAWRG